MEALPFTLTTKGGGFRKSETGVIAQDEFSDVEEDRGGDRGG